jgi:hypothetical protein
MSSERVANIAITSLRSRSPAVFQDVSCEYDGGTIVLRGRSSSYYNKQLAQETVRGINGVTQVVNEIEVTPTSVVPSTKSASSRPIHVAFRSLDVGVPDFEFVLTGSLVLIGRVEAADVRLTDPSVSRYHCEIGAINGTLWVRDLGSTHGVFVNGFREMQAYLMPGDRLSIGDNGFRVEFERHAPKSYEESLT